MQNQHEVGKAEEDLRDLFAELRFGRAGPTAAQRAQIDCRTICCTPLAGNYGTPAGWAVCLEGSPPKGTVLIMSREAERSVPRPLFYVTPGGFRWRRLAERQAQLLLPFWRQRLRDEGVGFELPGLPWPAARTA
jgi:hypothetical protein